MNNVARQAVNAIIYRATKTATQFHASDAFVRLLIGPIGSGKSVACVMEILARAQAQEPNLERVRKTRFAIIRNSYRELQDTTIQTFFDWIPRDMGEYRVTDMLYTIEKQLPDGTTMHCEVMFRALDRPDDVKKLLSLELTGAFINESRHIPRPIFDMLMGRVGRYPSKREGGPSWYGIWMDTNPPDVDHWIYNMFEEQKPDTWEVFHQPSGESADAENVENLPEGYYQNMQPGKDQEWINVYVHGRYGFVQDGKPVYPQYHDDIHFSTKPLPVVSDTLYVGLDFGLTPAAVILQRTVSGQWQAIDELVTEDMAALQFGPELQRILNTGIYRGCTFEIWGDPAGTEGAQTDKRTPFDILQAMGIDAQPVDDRSNDVEIRRNAVVSNLITYTMAGEPAFIVGPKCTMLRKGLAGGFKFRRVNVGGGEKFVDKPDKNKYSHVCEACEYGLMGAGEGHTLLQDRGRHKRRQPKVLRSHGRRR